MGHQEFLLTVPDIAVIRQALLLRQAQLRRSIATETDSSILRIRQEQFRHVDMLINNFRSADNQE